VRTSFLHPLWDSGGINYSIRAIKNISDWMCMRVCDFFWYTLKHSMYEHFIF